MFKLNKKGFTLIELLVVIAIIAVLASIVLVSLNTARVKGRDARRVADLKSIQNALELYYDSNQNVYPQTPSTALVPTYIPAYPKDPSGSTYYNSGNYYYAASGSSNATSYHLAAILEDSGNSAYNTDADLDSNALGYTNSGIKGGDAQDCDAATGTQKCYDVKN